jgi:D-alanyl-D-alanine carboxypeptidase/D-alanyl-D-alanine-endopeptidase (penicillin-binding protein 4)
VLAAVAVLAVIGLWFPPGRGTSGRAPAPVQLTTGVLSPRRVPGILARTVAQLRLAAGLDAVLNDPVLGSGREQSCLIVRQGDLTLFERRPTLGLIPASNLKLLTATALFDKLGPETKETTTVKADVGPAGGIINGNLYLVGGGDPLLRTSDYVGSLRFKELAYSHFDQVAQAVRAAGVTEVKGSVVGDETRYDTQRAVPTWKPSYASDGEVGPLSALEVNDGFAAFAPRLVPSPEPAVGAAGLLGKLLAERGVKVDGAATKGQAPGAAVTVASMSSLSVADSVAEILRQSDNTGAELLTKELGVRFGGAPTTAAGVAVIRQDLRGHGLPVDQLVAVDGSGLDRADRATCQLVLDALVRGGSSGPLAAALPVAGQTGTLSKRMVNTPAAGRVHAKTGALTGVGGLSGWVSPPALPTAPAAAPAPVVFAFLINGLPSRVIGETVEDRLGVLLAGNPQAPPVDQLGPLPTAAP